MSATAELSVTYATFLELLQQFDTVIQLAPGRILGQWKTGQWRAYRINDLNPLVAEAELTGITDGLTYTNAGNAVALDVNVANILQGSVSVKGSQAQLLQQRTGTFELLVQERSAGADIDPRSIRTLTSVDNVTVVGGNGIALLQDISSNLQVNPYLIGGQAKQLNSSANHLTTNATTNVTGADAWISTVVITVDVAGTTSTITIQDKSGTPKKLVNGLGTTALSTTPNVLAFVDGPVLMSGGIDIVTAGAVPGTEDVWISYWQ